MSDAEQILRDAWRRVQNLRPPVPAPPGTEWHFATGALWALGRAGLLDDEAIRRWEAHGRAEARRLRAPQAATSVRLGPNPQRAERRSDAL